MDLDPAYENHLRPGLERPYSTHLLNIAREFAAQRRQEVAQVTQPVNGEGTMAFWLLHKQAASFSRETKYDIVILNKKYMVQSSKNPQNFLSDKSNKSIFCFLFGL